MASSSANATTINLYESVQSTTIGIITPFAILAVASVILRFTARKIQHLEFKSDDWLSVAALIFTLGCFALSCKMVQLGSGRHTALVLQQSPQNVVGYLQCLFAYQLLYAHTILFIKASIISFYQRVFSVSRFKLWSNIVLGVVVAWYIAVVFVSIFSCNPVYGFWDKTTAIPAQCISTEAFFVGNAIPNIVTDIVIILLPIKMIWNLHVTTAQKVSLSFIFLLGSFVVVSSIVRLTAQFQVNDPDFFWAMNNTVIWTSLETSFGVISACLPTLRPLATWLFPRISGLRSTQKASNNGRSYGEGSRLHRSQKRTSSYGMNSWNMRRFEALGDNADMTKGTTEGGEITLTTTEVWGQLPTEVKEDSSTSLKGVRKGDRSARRKGEKSMEWKRDGAREEGGPLQITVERDVIVDRE